MASEPTTKRARVESPEAMDASMERVCNTAKLAVKKRADDTAADDDSVINHAVRMVILDALMELLWYIKMWTKNPTYPDPYPRRPSVTERMTRISRWLGVAKELVAKKANIGENKIGFF